MRIYNGMDNSIKGRHKGKVTYQAIPEDEWQALQSQLEEAKE